MSLKQLSFLPVERCRHEILPLLPLHLLTTLPHSLTSSPSPSLPPHPDIVLEHPSRHGVSEEDRVVRGGATTGRTAPLHVLQQALIPMGCDGGRERGGQGTEAQHRSEWVIRRSSHHWKKLTHKRLTCFLKSRDNIHYPDGKIRSDVNSMH